MPAFIETSRNLLTGQALRRDDIRWGWWSADFAAFTTRPTGSISYLARRHGLAPSLLFRRKRLMSKEEAARGL
jgi:hypothetical protein